MNIVIPKPVNEVLTILYENNYDGYIMGGTVRNLILGIKPKNYNHLERNARILVKYLSDGRILEGKYKHFEADLKLGVCILVDML